MTMTREEVAQLLYDTGFRGDDLVSMVAIAGRESHYDPGAHRTNADPGKMVGDLGLFQINYVNDTPSFRAALGMTDRSQLLDPEMNARAAFYLYKRAGLKPWTADNTGWTPDGDPLYGTDVNAARDAVDRASDLGMLGEPFDAADDASDDALDGSPDAPDRDNHQGGPSQADLFVQHALDQVGDRYKMGVTADPNDPNPTVFDCSELVEWAAARAGVPGLQEATYSQYNQMKAAHTTISVDEALHTRGALLFKFPGGEPPPGQDFRKDGYHVAISLGDGSTIEAMGTKYGVVVADDAEDRGWTQAALVAGMDYGDGSAIDEPLDGDPSPTPSDPLGEAAAMANSPDTDADMLPDFFEVKYGLAPDNPDTDGDGITDGYELIVLGTSPELADSDFDGIADGLELSLGLNPLVADNPDVDAPFVVPAHLANDSDGDGISDWGEELGGTDPDDPDTDDDGDLDGDELMDGTDPLSADA
jgi:cell wall-associated NlpC family hydrolase